MKMVIEITANTSATAQRISSLESSVATVESKVETIDSAFASYRKETDARLDALQQELVNVKISANNRDQLLRMKSVKVSGFPVSEEERSASDPEKFLAKRIYDKILVPILTAAKEDGALDSVPTLTKTIEVIRRINTWSPPSTSGSVPVLAPKEKAPPLVIVTLCSHPIRLALLRYKKDNMPSPSSADRSLGTKGFYISEDVTPPTAKLLRDLLADERVDRAWTVEGRIRYIRSGDANRRIYKVKSVYDSVSSILASSST
jgi:uncharacterized coiled-coil protein SlyX